MPANRYIRPTISAPPAMPPQLMPQPPIAPLVPAAHVVDLMTVAGSAMFGARWKGMEAKIVECPALTDSMPEFTTTYDIEPHAEIRGFDDSAWPVVALSADDAGDLVVRPHSTADDATPNPNAVAAGNLVRLAVLTGDEHWRAKADRLIDGIVSAQARNLFSHVALLNALDLRLRAAEIVVTGSAAPLVEAALKIPFLDRIVLRAPSAGALPASHPAQEKIEAAQGPAAFVCVGERCSLPVMAANDIANTVRAMRG